MSFPKRQTFAELQNELKALDTTHWKHDVHFVHNHRSVVLFQMPNGKTRRREISRLLQAGITIRVDARGCLQVKKDRDLQKLINDGVCVIVRNITIPSSSRKFLRLAKDTA